MTTDINGVIFGKMLNDFSPVRPLQRVEEGTIKLLKSL